MKNIQGDVIGIVDSTGNTVATYTYDAWGNITSSTGSLANINPIRYRGYYYDNEIDMYYLQSRYYDQNVGRFINEDDTNYIGKNKTLLSYNVFTYCENNFINAIDKNGYALKYSVNSNLYSYWSEGSFVANIKYSPKFWNDKKYRANCYAYALNIYFADTLTNTIFSRQLNKLQPGQLSGKYYWEYKGSYKNKLIKAFYADLEILGLVGVNANQYGPFRNYYLVSLVYGSDLNNNEKDYHWYRLDKHKEKKNGKTEYVFNKYWSHKRGFGEVSRKDASGKFIKDPKKANRNYCKKGVGINYNKFVGNFIIYKK